MTEDVIQEYITRETFDNEHNCITVKELHWMVKHVKRYSPMYLMIVLALDTGMRCNELLRLTLHHLNGFKSINYSVSKPKIKNDGATKITETKHRTVYLSDFAAQELKAYCDIHFIVIQTKDGPRYASPYRDKEPGKDGRLLGQKLFNWKNTACFDVEWFRLRRAMKKAGFDAERMETLSTWHIRQHKKPCYVVRFHKLRHMALTRYYYANGKDVKACQKWIKHSRGQTTDGYVHCAADLGVTDQELSSMGLPELLGLAAAQFSLTAALPPEQTILDMFQP